MTIKFFFKFICIKYLYVFTRLTVYLFKFIFTLMPWVLRTQTWISYIVINWSFGVRIFWNGHLLSSEWCDTQKYYLNTMCPETFCNFKRLISTWTSFRNNECEQDLSEQSSYKQSLIYLDLFLFYNFFFASM